MNSSSDFWSNHQIFLNNGVSVSIWLTNKINSNGTQNLVEPLPVLLQWLRDRKVSAKFAANRLILVFSYSTNKLTVSRLIIHVIEGHKTNPNIPKANILYFTILAPRLAFLAISSSSSRFNLKSPDLFFSLYEFNWGMSNRLASSSIVSSIL